MTKLLDIFPTTECDRCGGSGRYSWNAMHGDRCYGCNGTGIAWANKKIAAIVAEYTAAQKAAKQRLASELTPGVVVVADLGSSKVAGVGWATVVTVEQTDEICGWSGPDKTPTSWRMNVTLDDGTERDVMGNQIVRTFAEKIDVTPYAERAAKVV